jgi:hypothetical protein
MLKNHLIPMAAPLDALVIPHPHTPSLQALDHRPNPGIILMAIADEEIGFIPFVGFWAAHKQHSLRVFLHFTTAFHGKQGFFHKSSGRVINPPRKIFI